MARTRLRAALPMVFLGFVVGCNGVQPGAFCRSDVGLEVTVGTEVRFAWEEVCRPGSLEVMDDRGHVIWGVSGEIAPPVVYGQEPPGAETTDGPEDLEEGREYRVQLLLPEEGRVRVVAIQTFVG